MNNQEFNERTRQRIDFIRSEKKISYRKSLAIAIRAEYIIENMLKGSVSFTFITRTGKRRDVKGTLNSYKKQFGTNYNTKSMNCFIPYLDLYTGKWSAFHISSIIV